MNIVLRILQWSAWATGSLVLGFLLYMLAGHLFGSANGPNGMQFTTTSDLVSFLLFPVTTIIGLVLAYKWELLGGIIVIAGPALLCALRPELLHTLLAGLVLPGVLYVVHALVQHRRSHVRR